VHGGADRAGRSSGHEIFSSVGDNYRPTLSNPKQVVWRKQRPLRRRQREITNNVPVFRSRRGTSRCALDWDWRQRCDRAKFPGARPEIRAWPHQGAAALSAASDAFEPRTFPQVGVAATFAASAPVSKPPSSPCRCGSPCSICSDSLRAVGRREGRRRLRERHSWQTAWGDGQHFRRCQKHHSAEPQDALRLQFNPPAGSAECKRFPVNSLPFSSRKTAPTQAICRDLSQAEKAIR
jgi:hypothetical protein